MDLSMFLEQSAICQKLKIRAQLVTPRIIQGPLVQNTLLSKSGKKKVFKKRLVKEAGIALRILV